jgi:predicted ribosomally synthesized six-cysteine peptide SCIFF
MNSLRLYTIKTLCYINNTVKNQSMEEKFMKHIKTINESTLNKDIKNAGCGECQTSCQSACKTSCTVANQKCERK